MRPKTHSTHTQTFQTAFAALATLLVLLPAPTSAITINLVVNGDFDTLGTIGWTHGPSGSGTGPNLTIDCDGNAYMAQYLNSFNNNDRFSWQALNLPPVSVFGLEFDARIDVPGSTSNPGGNTIFISSNWRSGGTPQDAMVRVTFYGDEVALALSDVAPRTSTVSTTAPTDGDCHHYEVQILWDDDATSRHALLLIDGVPTLHTTGVANVPLGDTLYFGDASASGVAPGVSWDNIVFGPLV